MHIIVSHILANTLFMIVVSISLSVHILYDINIERDTDVICKVIIIPKSICCKIYNLILCNVKVEDNTSMQ